MPLLTLLRRGTRLYARLACAMLPRLPSEGPNTRLYARLACVEHPRPLRPLQLHCRRRPLDRDAKTQLLATICSTTCSTGSNCGDNCRFAVHCNGTLYELANPMPSLRWRQSFRANSLQQTRSLRIDRHHPFANERLGECCAVVLEVRRSLDWPILAPSTSPHRDSRAEITHVAITGEPDIECDWFQDGLEGFRVPARKQNLELTKHAA